MGSRQRRQYADLSVPRTHWDLTVELPEVGMRLDRFLVKRVRWMSRNELQRLITQRRITVNGDVRKSSTRVQERDRVLISIEYPDGLPDPSQIPIEILHEDEQLVVLNKQPGIVVHPVGIHQMFNLLAALHARYRDPDPEKDRVPHVCHRIDKYTSGVFMVAFREDWKAKVSLQFEARTVRKEYLALVHGVPDEAEGEIDAPLLFRDDGDPRVIVDEAGLASRTRWRVERDLGECALVRFFPRTGRTHQIRAHATHIGHPLLCDIAYGGRGPIRPSTFGPEPEDEAEEALIERCALHSTLLEIDHPGTGERTAYTAPLPADMARTVAHLEARPETD